jgi:hypothetical protein
MIEFDSSGRVIVPSVDFVGEDNIVFKMNWNDQGWKGICSKKAREYNESKHHRWCCDTSNKCKEMIEKGEKGYPCTESALFIDFRADPGDYLKGEKRKEKKYLRRGLKGKVAFFTTVAPGEKEEDRYFIGLFDVEKIENERDVYGNKENSVVISPKIKLKFWDYYKNKDESIEWGCGLVRYLNDATTLRILEDLSKKYFKLDGFEKENENLNMLIKRYKERS